MKPNTLLKGIPVILSCFFCSFLFAQEAVVSSIQLDASLSLDGLLVTPDGTLYGTEGYDGTRIFKINMDGTTEVFASSLSGPIDMDYDTLGNIYVSTFNNARLFKIPPTMPAMAQQFAVVNAGPSGVVVNRETSNVYVSHYGSGPGNGNSIYEATPDGTSSVFAIGNGLNVPVSLAIDEEGNLYAPNISDAKLFKITPAGDVSLLVALPTAPIHPFNIGHIAYANGALYVTGNDSQPLVFKVMLDGTYEIIAGDGVIGNLDGLGSEARFNGPNGIAASVTGDTLFISELNNPSAIRMIVLPTTVSSTEADNSSPKIKLSQNYPNPFEDQTTIGYELTTAENVKISVYNMEGRLVNLLLDEWKPAGNHTLHWSPEDLSPGTYICQLEAGGELLEKKIVFTKMKK